MSAFFFKFRSKISFNLTIVLILGAMNDIFREVFYRGLGVFRTHHQVDAAQGAAEMVEQLTEKTLEVEETIQQLQEEKADLVRFLRS